MLISYVKPQKQLIYALSSKLNIFLNYNVMYTDSNLNCITAASTAATTTIISPQWILMWHIFIDWMPSISLFRAQRISNLVQRLCAVN